MQYLRHGDLSFHKEEKAPELQTVEHNGSYVLALGEHTGHKHVITQDEGTVEIGYDTEGRLFLVIDGKATLTHEEHKPITFTSGVYRMENQREYDPFGKVIERVAD